MAAESPQVDRLVAEAAKLDPDARLRLIQRIAGTLVGAVPAYWHSQLEYGKYSTGRLSTEEDFALAEWRPNDDDLDSR